MYHVSEKIIKNKVGLLNLAEELNNVSKACKIMGFSRETFYRYKSAVDEGGVQALLEKTRRKPNYKNRVESETEKSVLDYAIQFPAHGQARTSNELRKKGVFISASGIRCIWLRHDLESFKKRLFALEKKSAEEGLVLTEAQVAALERKKEDDAACGEIETAHPGYLGPQDTFYVGDTVTLDLEFTNEPTELPRWAKDNIPLQNNDRILIENVGNRVTLIVRDLRLNDAGKLNEEMFTFVIENINRHLRKTS